MLRQESTSFKLTDTGAAAADAKFGKIKKQNLMNMKQQMNS